MNEFMGALAFRHACKLFDGRKIGDEDLRYILECGRLSPSSFGMEQWKFLVVQNEELKERLKPLCWDQPQITTCSDLVVILGKKETHLDPKNEYAQNMYKRRGLDNEKTAAGLKKYTAYYEDVIKKMGVFEWSARQCYIALANMMSGAAFVGIDSCAIEGFEKEKVEKELGIDTDIYEVAVMVAFGYRAKAQGERKRLEFDDVVEFV